MIDQLSVLVRSLIKKITFGLATELRYECLSGHNNGKPCENKALLLPATRQISDDEQEMFPKEKRLNHSNFAINLQMVLAGFWALMARYVIDVLLISLRQGAWRALGSHEQICNVLPTICDMLVRFSKAKPGAPGENRIVATVHIGRTTGLTTELNTNRNNSFPLGRTTV